MADQFFKNTPWGDVTIRDSWPQGIKNMWLDALKAAGVDINPTPGFVPMFDPQQYYSIDPPAPPVPLNRYDYATLETAAYLAKRYGATWAFIKLAYSTGPQTWLQWPDGTGVVAGTLAKRFLDNPEDQFPHVADSECQWLIVQARAIGQRVPSDSTLR